MFGMNLEEARQAAIALEKEYHDAMLQLQKDQQECYKDLRTIDKLESSYLGIGNKRSDPTCITSENGADRTNCGNEKYDKSTNCTWEDNGSNSQDKISKLDTKCINLLKHTIQELISTEWDYLESLNFLHKNFLKPIQEHVTSKDDREIAQKMYNFVKMICRFGMKFLTDLPAEVDNISTIGSVFQSHKLLFNYYAKLSQNWAAFMRLVETTAIKAIIKKREDDINEPLGFTRYVLKPIQRISKYELLLNNMHKQLPAHGAAANGVAVAVAYVHSLLNRCNTLVALSSIEFNKFEEKRTGNCILRTSLKHVKRRSHRSHEMTVEEVELFIFEKVLIFAININNELHFKDAILMKDLRLVDKPHPLRFSLEDFKKFKATGSLPRFDLEACNTSDKGRCVHAIRKILWDELEKLKRLASANIQEDNKSS